MYPWNHPRFKWKTKSNIPPITNQNKVIVADWYWGDLYGNGISWNNDKLNQFFIYELEPNPDYIEWPTIIYYEDSILPEIMLHLGWQRVIQDDNNWWFLQPSKLSLQWGEISRKIESSLHLPNLNKFQYDIKQHIQDNQKENAWKNIPSNPYGQTIWHKVWSYWLTSETYLDNERIFCHNFLKEQFDNSGLSWVDIWGNTWLHQAARVVESEQGWLHALQLATEQWGCDISQFPMNLHMQTAHDILFLRVYYEKNKNSWIKEYSLKLYEQSKLESPKTTQIT